MLELKNITKVVGADTHIHPTNLVLERGSLNVLLGPTLSGKTSLMRLMAGLDKPTTGSVYFDGKDVTGVRVQDRSVAMVYQQFINYPAMTVYENIASPMRIAGKDKATIDREVRKAADLMRLTPFLDRTPLSLSGGQQQRTALARAIVKNASLVLLDEPLANLDYKLREELREELPKLLCGIGLDLRLCNHRAGRSPASRRQYRDLEPGTHQPVRPDHRRLPSPQRSGHRKDLCRPAAEHDGTGEEWRSVPAQWGHHAFGPGASFKHCRWPLHGCLPAASPVPEAIA